jgi:hypothetical protein
MKITIYSWSTRDGRMCEQLDEGLRHINEWRRWITANLDTAKRARDQMGLGLTRGPRRAGPRR